MGEIGLEMAYESMHNEPKPGKVRWDVHDAVMHILESQVDIRETLGKLEDSLSFVLVSNQDECATSPMFGPGDASPIDPGTSRLENILRTIQRNNETILQTLHDVQRKIAL